MLIHKCLRNLPSFVLFVVFALLFTSVIVQRQKTLLTSLDDGTVVTESDVDLDKPVDLTAFNKSVVIDVAIVASSAAYVKQAKTFVTSLLLFSSVRVRLHLITDAESYTALQRALTSISGELLAKCNTFYYSIDNLYKSVLKKYDIEMEDFVKDKSKQLMIKLLLPEIFPLSHKVLMIDTDVIALGDVYELWKEFDRFGTHHVMGMGPEGYTYVREENRQPFAGEYGLNDGITLIDIKKSNDVSFVSDIVSYVMNNSSLVRSHHDQGFFNLYFHDHPERIHHLPCHLVFHADIDGCSYINRAVFRNCPSANQNGALFLHGTTGRFASADGVTDVQREHMKRYVVAPGTQLEYRFMYETFEQMRNPTQLTLKFFHTIRARFAALRNGYCHEMACKLCPRGENLLKMLFDRIQAV